MGKKKPWRRQHTFWRFMTWDRWIANESRKTCARRSMICYVTFGIDSTNTRTWVYTFLVDTSFGFGAICIEDTFRTTFNIRISFIFRDTTARTSPILFLANCINATRARITRHWDFKWNWGDYINRRLKKGIYIGGLLRSLYVFFLLGIGWHPVNGSPVYWSWQRQIGWWPVTLQLV